MSSAFAKTKEALAMLAISYVADCILADPKEGVAEADALEKAKAIKTKIDELKKAIEEAEEVVE